MTVRDKIVAGILLAHGVFGFVWTFWVASGVGFKFDFLATNLVLALAGIGAGVGWWQRRRWARGVAVLFYVAQLLHVATPTFLWSFTLGLSMVISFGWSGTGQFGINLLALIMLLWIGWQIRAADWSTANVR